MATTKPKTKSSFWQAIVIPWSVCMIAALFYGYDFFLRVAPSVMIHPLMHTYKVDALTIGFISAFYYYAYTPLQIPSGIVVDRFNLRNVLLGSVLLCAVGAFMFAFIPNLYVAYLSRILMGAGSAFAFCGSLKLAARWLPRKQFALYSGIATALGTIGAVCADWILSRLVTLYGWQQAVAITGYVGLVIAVLIVFFVRSMPPWLKGVYIPKMSWKKSFFRLWIILKTGGFWFNSFVGCVMFLPINVFASLWGVAYLIEAHQFSPTEAAGATSLIFIGSSVCSPIAGWFSDFIKSRRIPLFIGNAMILIIVLFLIYTNIESSLIVFGLLFFLGFFAGPQALVFAISREISPPHTTGMSTASTNFVVTLGAALFQPFIGFILDSAWKGVTTSHGTPIYTVHAYKSAFMVLPISMGLSFLATFLIPKTGCQKLYGEAVDFEHVPDEKNPYHALNILNRKKSD